MAEDPEGSGGRSLKSCEGYRIEMRRSGGGVWRDGWEVALNTFGSPASRELLQLVSRGS